jgi:hypothetical protein
MADEAKARNRTISLHEGRARHRRDGICLRRSSRGARTGAGGLDSRGLPLSAGLLEVWGDPDSPYHKDIFASRKEVVF